MERVEVFLQPLALRMIRSRSDIPQKLIQVFEGVVDRKAPADLPCCLQTSCHIWTSQRVMKNEFPLALSERYLHLRSRFDLLPCHSLIPSGLSNVAFSRLRAQRSKSAACDG